MELVILAGYPGAVVILVDQLNVNVKVERLLALESSGHIEGLTEVKTLTGALGILSIVDLEHVLDSAYSGDALLESGEHLVDLFKGFVIAM